MNMNVMSFLLGKAVAKDLGEERSTQLGLVAGLMPGFQGVLMSAVIARREKPKETPIAVSRALTREQLEELKQSVDATLLAAQTGTPTQNGGPRAK